MELAYFHTIGKTAKDKNQTLPSQKHNALPNLNSMLIFH
jgi:hypothetical protein